MRSPNFPTSEKHGHHQRAVLAMLLSGERVDQFSYHAATGLPMVDFRTRISELSRHGPWPIDRKFHVTRDFNGEPRRVKKYWLNRGVMRAFYSADPAFKRRCKAFAKQWGPLNE